MADWEPWTKVLSTTGERIVCCDCGLAHDIDFRIHDGELQWRWRRHESQTAKWRRKKKFRMVPH